MQQALAPTTDGRRKRGLDIGSSTPWIEEMAVEFPHVKWFGVDLVQTRQHNASLGITYQYYDFRRGLMYSDGAFDLPGGALVDMGART